MDGLFDIGPDSLRRLFATWYGPPDRAGAIPAGAGRLPRPLQAWYQAASHYSTPVTFHHTILDPDQIEEADGKLVFWRKTKRSTSGPPTPTTTIRRYTSAPPSTANPGTPPACG